MTLKIRESCGPARKTNERREVICLKRIIIVVLCLVLLLTACSRTDPSAGSMKTLPVVTGSLRPATPGQTWPEDTDAAGTVFSEQELRDLNTFLDWRIDRIPCMFLTCSYDRPEDIDFDLVFYNGISSNAVSEPVPDAEKAAVAKAIGQESALERGLYAVKRPKAKVVDLICRYTGLSEESAAAIELSYPYVAEYDAYYSFYEDNEVIMPKVKRAVWLDETHTLAQVKWTDPVRNRAGTAIMEKTAEGWHFVSNHIER